MEECCKSIDIMFVQGDILEVTFEVLNIPKEAISKMYVNIKGLNLSVECPYVEKEAAETETEEPTVSGGYMLRLESENTATFPTVIASYDLVAALSDGNYLTLIREGLFAVLKRRNCLCEAEEGDGNNEGGDQTQI